MERDVLMPRGGGKDTGVPAPEHGGQQEAVVTTKHSAV